MKKILYILCFLPVLLLAQSKEEMIKKIYDETLMNSPVHQSLRVLCKDIGHRLSGSPQAAAAVEYTRQLMESYEFDTVYLQPVMVPRWVRGEKEVARVTNSNEMGAFDLRVLALGNSVGTGIDGILAEVIELGGLDEVEKYGKKLEGKIVFFNGKMDPTVINNFAAYGKAVAQRGSGASDAAKYGAKAVIVRSVTNRLDDIPHTGSLRYKPLTGQIPAVAVSTNDAEKLSMLLKSQDDLKVYLRTTCEMKDPVLSYNVIGELRGNEFPEEIISVGGHLDSWDVGEGAHDDGSGCMQAIDALRTFKALGIQPKRTLRAVMWMNEENGLMGGREYAKVAKEKGENHIAAIESDAGGFRPLGFSMSGTEEQKNKVKAWNELFLPYGVWNFDQPGGGADIGPLGSLGTLLIGLRPNTQSYFIYHHTPADVFERVDKRELELGAASMSALVWLLDQEGL
ncbi:MAG: M20/M25/M40 family metallo-hydrolase [Cyclobacteriaceae bacterium]